MLTLLPPFCRRFSRTSAGTALLALCTVLMFLFTACKRGEPLTPEQQVEAALSGMADAARAGDASAVMDFVHGDYTDDETGSKFVLGQMILRRIGEGVGVSYDIVELTVQPDETVSALIEANFRGVEGRSGVVNVHTRWVSDGDSYMVSSSQVDRNARQ
jgi:hypothetical protein